MADIDLVITIPETLYNNLKTGCGIYPYRLIYDAILTSTPLPKGHGRLIDADELIDGRLENDNTVILVHNAKTIIPADKEGED